MNNSNSLGIKNLMLYNDFVYLYVVNKNIFMTRILISGLLIAIILFIFGARSAANEVLDWTLTIVKWIFIIGVGIFIGVMIFSRKK
jgi:hypothetical protein